MPKKLLTGKLRFVEPLAFWLSKIGVQNNVAVNQDRGTAGVGDGLVVTGAARDFEVAVYFNLAVDVHHVARGVESRCSDPWPRAQGGVGLGRVSGVVIEILIRFDGHFAGIGCLRQVGVEVLGVGVVLVRGRIEYGGPRLRGRANRWRAWASAPCRPGS